VFALNPKTGSEKVVYSFCSQPNCADGAGPEASLIAVKGMLYGTTGGGGTNMSSNCEIGCGTVFSLDPKTGVEKVLYSFCGEQNCIDGRFPVASLIDVGDTFYGTTEDGGDYNFGTVYSLDPSTGAETVLNSFCGLSNCADGAFPASDLIKVKGMLFGTTTAGGASTGCNIGCGTVFSFDLTTGGTGVLYSFGYNNDLEIPWGGLVAVNGVLYGTVEQGGDNGCVCGAVFSLDPKTDSVTVLHSFGGGDGANPYSSLIDIKGALYGTTWAGGNEDCAPYIGCGTVFSIDPSTGTETVLYSFCSRTNCTDGANPQASLIAVKGMLYGTTYYGGAYLQSYGGLGTVFELKKR
jgi:uncharacterized repeat protein (TIGR03803 family)